MQTISVALQNRSYPIWIRYQLLDRLPELLKPMNQNQKWLIFSQLEIYNLYGKLLISNLEKFQFNTELILLPEGEDAKCFEGIEKIFSQLIKMGCDRSSTFVALGGGVVGDVTGFIAATFMRGVEFIQIPTTLLAMIDSSIGGKTGVNLKNGKNLVGSIWQPKAVIIDPQMLRSLPSREIVSALGEVIKYGIILDRKLFDFIEKNIDKLQKMDDPDLFSKVIGFCAKLKADLISKDEFDNNQRQILNFGHTIGHALETHFGFEVLRHGEAITFGMLVATQLSIEYSKLDQKQFNLINNVIRQLSLPSLPPFKSKDIIQIMRNDKKFISGKIKFVLIEEIGHAVLKNNVREASIVKILESL